MTCTVSPFDRIRTSLMNQPPDAKIYNGFVDCVVKTVRSDGITSLWRGFIPMYVVITAVVVDVPTYLFCRDVELFILIRHLFFVSLLMLFSLDQ